jgi:raffinose/stachyose/melibiose transport system substrate-binding protein
MKKILALVLTVLMVLALATPVMAEGEIKLTFSNFNTEEEVKNNAEAAGRAWALDHFNEINAGKVQIESTAMSHDDYAIKIQAQAAADDLPDLFFLKGSWVENFAENDLMADLTDYFNALPNKDDYYAGEFKSATLGGKIYGTPIQFVSPTSLMFSNKKLWADAGYETIPTTFDEIFAAAPKFNEKGIPTIALGNKDNWPYESCWISCLGDRFTGTAWFNGILARDGSSKFTDPAFVDMLKFTKALGQSGVLNADYNSITHDESISMYNQGKSASLISGYWPVANIIGNATPEVKDNTVITLLPQPAGASGGDPNSLSNASGWFLAVNNKLEGAKREAAIKAAFELYGVDYCDYMGQTYGMLSPMKVKTMKTDGVDPLTTAYNEIAGAAAASGVPVYDVELNGSIIDVMNKGLQEVLAGTMEPEALAEMIQAEQDALS